MTNPAKEALNNLVAELREASQQTKSQDIDWALGKALEAQSNASRVTLVLCGVAGSGKDTVAEYLKQHYGFHVESFAAPLKQMAKLAFPEFKDEHLYGSSSQRAHEYRQYPLNPESPYYHETRKFISPRLALQTLGTDWGRGLNDRIWIEGAFARLKLASAQFGVISDGRFANEVLLSRSRGALAVRLTRGLNASADPHPSEAEMRSMVDHSFDYVLKNTGHTSVKELYSMVDVMLKELSTNGITFPPKHTALLDSARNR